MRLFAQGGAAGREGAARAAARPLAVEPFELAARESIRDLVARYNANGDAGRFDAMLALFARTRRSSSTTARPSGKPAIRALFEGVAQRTGSGALAQRSSATSPPRTRSTCSPRREARGRCYFAVLTERGLDHWGRYVDEYRRDGGRWLFQRRKVTLDAAVPGGWAGRSRFGSLSSRCSALSAAPADAQARRLAGDRRRSRRRALLAAHRHHARERRAAARRVDLPARRLLARAASRCRVNRGTAFESTPIVVDGRLFFTTPRNRVIALDPETGRELWTFDPAARPRPAPTRTCGSTAASPTGATPAATAPARARVFLATLDARLIALDAATGTPCAGLRRERRGRSARRHRAASYDDWEYNVTSPRHGGRRRRSWSARRSPTRCGPTRRPATCAPSTCARGALRWTFHTIPHAGRARRRDLGDRHAAHRRGERVVDDHRRPRARPRVPAGQHAEPGLLRRRPARREPLLATRSSRSTRATGERVWHFQTVHHDLWDYDLAAPPVLVRARSATASASTRWRRRPSTASCSCSTARPARRSSRSRSGRCPRATCRASAPGRRSRFRRAPPPLVPQRLDEADLYAPTPEHLAACRERLARAAQRRPLHAAEPARLGRSTRSPAAARTGRAPRWDPSAQLLFVPVQQPRARDPRSSELAERATRRRRRRAAAARRRRCATLVAAHRARHRRALPAEPDRRAHAASRTTACPCNPPPWGRARRASTSRAARSRWSASTERSATATPG